MKPKDKKRLEEIRKGQRAPHGLPPRWHDVDFLLKMNKSKDALIDEQAAENKHLKELFDGEDKENLKLLSEVNALRSEVERLVKLRG
jgi:hypothetical protein